MVGQDGTQKVDLKIGFNIYCQRVSHTLILLDQ